MTDERLLKQLSEAVNSVLAFEQRAPELIERPDWGDFKFSEAKPHIEFFIWFANQVRNFSFDVVPDEIARSAINFMCDTAHELKKLDEFNIDRDDPASFRNTLYANNRKNINSLVRHMGNWLPIISAQFSESQGQLAQMEELRSKMENVLNESEEYSSQKKEEVDKAVQASRNVAGEAGAAEFTVAFKEEANTQKKRAWIWTGVTFGFGLVLLLFSLSLIFGWLDEPPSNLTKWSAIPYFAGRLFAFSILFYAATWAGRMALACFNLASVNRDRALSVQTLQAFHAAAGDEAAKDAVVMTAAQAVYENVPTGFLGKAGAASTQPVISRMVDVVRGRGRS